MIINNLDELDDIKRREKLRVEKELIKNNKLELAYLKRCFEDMIFDTEWSEEANDGVFNYTIGVGVELEEFSIDIYVEAVWDTELRGRLDFSNYRVLSIVNRDLEDINPTELESFIISKISK